MSWNTSVHLLWRPCRRRNRIYFNLCLSLSEVSFAVEVYRQPEVPNSMQELGEAERFVIVHD